MNTSTAIGLGVLAVAAVIGVYVWKTTQTAAANSPAGLISQSALTPGISALSYGVGAGIGSAVSGLGQSLGNLLSGNTPNYDASNIDTNFA